MPNSEIRYTPGDPVYQPPLFCNRDREVALILDSLKNRRTSCAVVAGANMGKTSLLRHLESLLADELSQAKGSYSEYLVPAYVEVETPSHDHPHPLRHVLLSLIAQTASRISATVLQCLGVQLLTDTPQWELRLTARANQDPFREFEAALLLITQEINDQLGHLGVIRPVLLIDEVHRLADSSLPRLNVSVARALVRLLDTPYLKSPFVLACTRPVSEQLPTEDDKELASKIDCVPLPVLPRDGCSYLIYEPLRSIYGLEKSELLSKEVEAAIYREVGGHPFFMHYIMSEVCIFEDLSQVQVSFIGQKTEAMSIVCREYAKSVMYQISEHDLGRQVFDRFCQSGGELSYSAIAAQFPGYRFMLADALDFLKCLGVLREVATNDVYAVTGELFKRWFVSEGLRPEAEKSEVSFVSPELRQLIKRIKQGDCILFVGSGVSTEANLPGTGKLIAELASEIDYPLKGGESLAVISQYVEDKLGRDRLLNFLEERLIGADIANSHRLVPKIPWAAVYTTNYDTLIEEGYRQGDKGWRSILRSADFTADIKPHQALIVKLHGCLTTWRSQETRPIITEDDYQKYSDNRHALFAKLRSDLYQKVVLFIGFGLTDQDFQQVYTEVKQELGELQHLSYAVMPDCDEFAQRHWRKNNVFLVKATAGDFLAGLLDYVK